MANEINNLDGRMDDKTRDAITMLAEGLVKAGDDVRALAVSLSSIQTILAALVNPANPEAAFQQILERDRLAQSLSPAPQADTFRAMIQALKNGTWGQA